MGSPRKRPRPGGRVVDDRQPAHPMTGEGLDLPVKPRPVVACWPATGGVGSRAPRSIATHELHPRRDSSDRWRSHSGSGSSKSRWALMPWNSPGEADAGPAKAPARRADRAQATAILRADAHRAAPIPVVEFLSGQRLRAGNAWSAGRARSAPNTCWVLRPGRASGERPFRAVRSFDFGWPFRSSAASMPRRPVAAQAPESCRNPARSAVR